MTKSTENTFKKNYDMSSKLLNFEKKEKFNFRRFFRNTVKIYICFRKLWPVL